MIVESKFDLRDSKRPDQGNGRTYDLENVSQVIEASQWKIGPKQSLMLGFLGHNNSFMVQEGLQTQPSNVCTRLKLNGSIVEHTQTILETDTGKVVKAMNNANAGGWSWRAQGDDGGREGVTTLSEIGGFDFVFSPSFMSIKESTDDPMILQVRTNLIEEGLTDTFADQFLSGMSNNITKEMTRLQEEVKDHKRTAARLTEALAQTTQKLSDEQKEALEMVTEALDVQPYGFRKNQKILELLSRGCKTKMELKLVLETLTNYRDMDLSDLPINEQHKPEKVKNVGFGEDPEFDFNKVFNHHSSKW